MPSMEGMLSSHEAAKYLGVCRFTLSKYRSDGMRGKRLRAYRVGGKFFFDRADLDAWMTVTGDPAPSVKPSKADNSAAREYLRQNGYRV